MVNIASTCASTLAASAILTGTNLTGQVTFIDDGDSVSVKGTIYGLAPSALHGFHVHTYGDVSGPGCLATGGHFNPYNTSHGAPTESQHHRHVGDLGNIQADANGTAIIDITDRIISLHGKRSILGRGLVVHAGQDDLGLGNNTDSKLTGNAGARAGCGVIGVANATAILALD
ncbi:Superoxide dismutase [Cu-Zn] [Apiotrichum porosum]|uniref:Superoxide dismutase [Cu-Zn] n=1 Tax=Apiotrichum porosum TaxID=105984 RepID=A0A427Y5Z5_9TREE|nr:Superoxide dismutase [Cu-Zn] [Apiotrichum porosum]RSH86500.1 Superoxide dismutase [Cu-Zn] [Apiotrichum porosum]